MTEWFELTITTPEGMTESSIGPEDETLTPEIAEQMGLSVYDETDDLPDSLEPLRDMVRRQLHRDWNIELDQMLESVNPDGSSG